LLRGPLGISKVEETGSLDEALGRLAEAPGGISLALFDLSMPGMEGPGTLSAVRECYPDVRVAVVSASQSRQDVLASLETGVHGYIPKGFGPLELVRALKIIISGDIFVPAFLADMPAAGGGHQQSSGPRNHGASNENVAAMSPRQREVLALLVKGYSNKQIAGELSLGEGTVKVHVAALLRNLGVANRAGAAAAGAILLRA
jgi:DNA-binding NarL/FixJ family response regulator